MHERGSLKSMSGPFTSEKGVCQTTQVFVDLRHHLANRSGIGALGRIHLGRREEKSMAPRETAWASQCEPLP